MNAKAEKEKKIRAMPVMEKALDVVPGLKGDRDRKGFVIKVYSLVSIMLIVTAVWVTLVYSSVGLKSWVLSNLWLYWITLILSICIMCSMMCAVRHFREVPMNYITLAVFTVTHAYFVAAICT